MEIQEKVAQDLKRPALDRKNGFFSCKSKTENLGFHRILDKQSASSVKIFR
jgi:hypothetical protein